MIFPGFPWPWEHCGKPTNFDLERQVHAIVWVDGPISSLAGHCHITRYSYSCSTLLLDSPPLHVFRSFHALYTWLNSSVAHLISWTQLTKRVTTTLTFRLGLGQRSIEWVQSRGAPGTGTSDIMWKQTVNKEILFDIDTTRLFSKRGSPKHCKVGIREDETKHLQDYIDGGDHEQNATNGCVH